MSSEEIKNGDVATRRDVKACDIYKLLMDKYSDERQWLCAGEVADTTGFGKRRLDFVAVNCYESQGYGIHAFEIKISKADLRRELEEPSKHNIFFDWVDTYSICAPDYVLDAEYKSMIPPKWGVYTLSTRIVKDEKSGEPKEERYLKTVRKPLNLHDDKDLEIKRSFAMSLLRSIRNQNAQRFYLEDLLKKEYERGRADGIAIANQGREEVKRMVLDEEKWKSRFCDELNIRSAERANDCLHKVNTMTAVYNEIVWFNSCVSDLSQSVERVKKISEAFQKCMAKDNAEKGV